MRSRKIFGVVLIWAIIISTGLIGAEVYARQAQGDKIWSLSKQKKNYFWQGDKVTIWNRQFVEDNPYYFSEWPIPLEVFESDKPTPRYLFKPNMRLAWKLETNELVLARPGDPVFWSSNSWGFRGPEFPVRKASDSIRVVCLGASTTEHIWGDNETYPHYLQDELNGLLENGKIEVINAGHRGHTVDDLLEILRQRVLPLEPDIVIFYEAMNNVWRGDFTKTYLPCMTEAETGCLGCGSCWLLNYATWYQELYKHSALFTFVSDALWNNAKPPPMPHDFDLESPKHSVIHFTQVLREIARETINHNSTIVFSSFITLAHEGLDTSYKENPTLFNDLYKRHYPFTPGEVAKIFDYINQQTAALARELKIPYADVATNFPRDPRYFSFDMFHFTAEGNRLLANAFAKFLAAEILPKIISTRARLTGTVGSLYGLLTDGNFHECEQVTGSSSEDLCIVKQTAGIELPQATPQYLATLAQYLRHEHRHER